MRSGNARYSANPGDIAMQSNLICVPTLAIVKARPADQAVIELHRESASVARDEHR
jgi:hypothetical protein